MLVEAEFKQAKNISLVIFCKFSKKIQLVYESIFSLYLFIFLHLLFICRYIERAEKKRNVVNKRKTAMEFICFGGFRSSHEILLVSLLYLAVTSLVLKSYLSYRIIITIIGIIITQI